MICACRSSRDRAVIALLARPGIRGGNIPPRITAPGRPRTIWRGGCTGCGAPIP